MIFLASTLVMNGGTTFLLRIAKEYNRCGRRCAVLLMTDRVDAALKAEVELYADVLLLRHYLQDRGNLARGLLGSFAPLRRRALDKALEPYGPHLHAMGLFAVILGMRLSQNKSRRLTAGVYHQNEFLYEAPPFRFARKGQEIFSAIPARNLVFFNEASRENYVQFFRRLDYRASAVLPIGISIDMPPAPRTTIGRRVVSIGNLVSFKTYNRHMIGVIAALKERFPDISYDIYGTGPTSVELLKAARDHGVEDRVRLRGPISYERFRDVVADCDLFVGSGTALIEAAAVGRPAMIGIESFEEPQTYGFLHDATGFSYNENVDQIPKKPMETLVRQVFSDEGFWQEIAEACYQRSLSFSIEVTARGLEELGTAAVPFSFKLPPWELVRLAASAVAMAVFEKVGRGRAFGDRRNQSFGCSTAARPLARTGCFP